MDIVTIWAERQQLPKVRTHSCQANTNAQLSGLIEEPVSLETFSKCSFQTVAYSEADFGPLTRLFVIPARTRRQVICSQLE